MKRLNFEQHLAEKPTMNRIDGFFILILVLFSALTVVYKSAQYELGEAQLLRLRHPQLVKKIKQLEAKNQDLESQLSRRTNRSDESRKLASEPKANPIQSPEKVYQQLTSSCGVESSEKLKCLDYVDVLVSQFPESTWTAKGILVLAQIQLKEHRNQKAMELAHVLRGEFQEFLAKDHISLSQLKKVEQEISRQYEKVNTRH